MRRPDKPTHDSGMVVLWILLMVTLISVVGVGVLQFVAADLAAGIRQMQSVQVFNVAEAGVSHALAQLQSPGAVLYAGENITMTAGSAVTGTAAITVGCADGLLLPCLGPYVAFRRIVSVGTVSASGPRRTVVAVAQALPQGITDVVCAQVSATFSAGVTIYGNVGSNGSISLQGSADNYSSVRRDPPPPYVNFGYYAGNARAEGAITCSQGCAVQVQGTTTPNAPGPVCPVPALPTFSPGSADQTVTTSGWTMNASTGYNWRDITVQSAGTATGCVGLTPFSDLRIQAGAAGTTTVVNIRRLNMGRCGRLVILGEGNVELRVGEQNVQAIYMGQYGRFGVLGTDTLAVPMPVPAGRLKVYVNSRSATAVHVDRATILSGIFVAPNGGWDQDQLIGVSTSVYGAIMARTLDVDRNAVITYDPTVATYLSFNVLRSWKDQ